MTEQERIDRARLLRRAAAIAGGAYVAPLLTSSATAETEACAGQPCKPGKKGKKKCKKAGGRTCRCGDGVCGHGDGPCDVLPPCSGGDACADPIPCQAGNCLCLRQVPGAGPGHRCVDGRDGVCSSFPTCDRNGNGFDCPAGACCMDSCCPTGICAEACSDSHARWPLASTGQTLYRV
jgi:hypothetical protein